MFLCIMIRKKHDSFSLHWYRAHFTVDLHYGGEDGAKNHLFFFHHWISCPSKCTGHAGPPSVSFECPLAILRTIAQRRLILTPDYGCRILVDCQSLVYNYIYNNILYIKTSTKVIGTRFPC